MKKITWRPSSDLNGACDDEASLDMHHKYNNESAAMMIFELGKQSGIKKRWVKRDCVMISVFKKIIDVVIKSVNIGSISH